MTMGKDSTPSPAPLGSFSLNGIRSVWVPGMPVFCPSCSPTRCRIWPVAALFAEAERTSTGWPITMAP